jgi:hypothetical protein
MSSFVAAAIGVESSYSLTSEEGKVLVVFIHVSIGKIRSKRAHQ